jgi:hypothetical protein
LNKGILLIGLLALGCAGSFEEAKGAAPIGSAAAPAPDPAYCRGLDSEHRVWGGIAKGAGAVAAGLGAGLIPDESKDLRIGLAAGAIGAGAIAATSVFISEDAAVAYVKDCSK